MSASAAPLPAGAKVVAPDFYIYRTDSEADYQRALVVRFKVFCEEQGYDAKDEVDLDDQECAHFLLVHSPSGEAVGTVRFMPSKAKLGRLAVLQDYRKHKLGAALVRAVKDHAVRAAMDRGEQEARVMCHSQAYVVGFYEKLGYRPEGERFLEEGTEHQKMVLTIPV